MSNVSRFLERNTEKSAQYFARKLACETDCSDVYADIRAGENHFVLIDVRSHEAFAKSHAMTAINIPHAEITQLRMQQFHQDTLFVVYCWGPGCNGASKAAQKLSALGYRVKEMIGGIHYWEDFERYPVNRRVDEAQS
ncbi:sulfurtransferase [Pseudoalteromonas sp. SMS1]|uniref:rhodanese-like domain-containing protein n=1 Tax=Pseudoalteromonas sp. SMS1 TaxID=2908894 RepID=UPI001F1C6AB8|nr:rhodanese-like domain-containing protein [Pseudoalteromonas sp. SMS1]MCF2860128.1 sulfurtransferase [Pseudoalteromonas sp. SMS1]